MLRRVLVVGEVVTVERDGVEVARRRAEGLGRFVAAARDLTLGWGRLPDDAEVIYLYDAGDDGCREWGSAPFGGEAPVLAATTASGFGPGPLPFLAVGR